MEPSTERIKEVTIKMICERLCLIQQDIAKLLKEQKKLFQQLKELYP